MSHMAHESRSYSGPRLEDVRKDLAAVVTGGLVADSVAEKGRELLGLEIVVSRARLPVGAGEDERDQASTEALTAVLKEAVEERLLFRKHRRLLRYVLPLEAEYLDRSIEERRAAAGKNMTKKPVKPGTIRTYYEPRALDELARILVEMEAEYRGEQIAM